MKKIFALLVLCGLLLLCACGGESESATDAQQATSGAIENMATEVKQETQEQLSATQEETPQQALFTEELLQGTWEYYDSEIGFGEILVFDNGKVDYTCYLDAARDKDSYANGTYRFSAEQVVTTMNNYDSHFTVESDNGEFTLNRWIDSGADKGKTRVFRQTKKGELNSAISNSSGSSGSGGGFTLIDKDYVFGEIDSNATAGEKNALSKAKSYLRSSAFSHEGLIEQLEYEGYSYSEAKYGADHCGADWNEQAVAKAKSYLRSSAFSYKGLVEQLEYEGFTSAQAKHGADLCGADWYEQAVKKAASYLRVMSFSRSELIDQLEYEGFSYDQAVHGVNETYGN